MFTRLFIIGDSWPYNLDELTKIKDFADDKKFQREVMQVGYTVWNFIFILLKTSEKYGVCLGCAVQRWWITNRMISVVRQMIESNVSSKHKSTKTMLVYAINKYNIKSIFNFLFLILYDLTYHLKLVNLKWSFMHSWVDNDVIKYHRTELITRRLIINMKDLTW